MKSYRLMSIFVTLLILGLGACSETPTPSSHGGPVKDYVSLVDHLRTAGASVVPVGQVTQPFFSVSGQTITVNGAQVQVYEYANEDDANSEAARISPDGSKVGNTIVDWTASPHFYKKSKIIVLYIGTNTSIMHILETTLGSPFAGR